MMLIFDIKLIPTTNSPYLPYLLCELNKFQGGEGSASMCIIVRKKNEYNMKSNDENSP